MSFLHLLPFLFCRYRTLRIFCCHPHRHRLHFYHPSHRHRRHSSEHMSQGIWVLFDFQCWGQSICLNPLLTEISRSQFRLGPNGNKSIARDYQKSWRDSNWKSGSEVQSCWACRSRTQPPYRVRKQRSGTPRQPTQASFPGQCSQCPISSRFGTQ